MNNLFFRIEKTFGTATDFASRRSHVSREDDDTPLNGFLFQYVKESLESRTNMSKKSRCSNEIIRYFLMDLTPTLFSSEKNTKIWSVGFDRDVV